MLAPATTTTTLDTIDALAAKILGTVTTAEKVEARLAELAARGGDGDATALAEFYAQSGRFAHGWTCQPIGTVARDNAADIAAEPAYTNWRDALVRIDEKQKAWHPNKWGIGYLPPVVGGPFVRASMTRRYVWGVLPGGITLRIVTRKGTNEGALVPVVVEGLRESDVVYVSARLIREGKAHRVTRWGASRPRVSPCRGDAPPLAPYGAEERHCNVLAALAGALDARALTRSRACAWESQEATLAAVLGRPFPR